MTGDTFDANVELNPGRIPLLGAADLRELLSRMASGERRQLHLVFKCPWEDEFIWEALFRAHGSHLDRKAVFHIAESPGLADWGGRVSSEALSFVGCGLQAGDYDFLGKIEGLSSLSLAFNKIGDDVAATIAERLSGLKSLDMWENQIRDTGAKAIAERLTGLTSLRLTSNQIGDDGAKAIAERLSGLALLDLASNLICDDGAKALAERLCGLTSLDLSANKVGDEGAKAIAEWFAKRSLLDLPGNQIDVRGTRWEWLSNRSLLDLRANRIGDIGARAIADRLSGELTSLYLGNNQIGNDGAKAIAERLFRLTSLDLGHNQIRDEGAKAIAERISGLISLDLRNNQIGDDGVYALANLFGPRAIQRLSTLNLEGNNILRVDAPTLATHDAHLIFEVVRNGVALPHARIMLVGMGGVGKSLLARRTFLDCVQREGRHEETHDILVLRPEECQWMPRIVSERDEPQVQTWVWDFAGQLVTHGVHESFLKDEGRTVYVVVLAADREPGQEGLKHEGNRLRYWLQMLRYTVGSVAPVIIVITRNDKWDPSFGPRPVDSLLAWPELTPARAVKDVELDEFSNGLKVSVIKVVTDFSACDATYPIREGLQRVIQDAVLQLGVVKEKRVPRGFVALKNLVDERLLKRTLVARTELDVWCAEVKIEDPTLRDQLLRILHHMGSVIYWGRTETEGKQPPQRDRYHGEEQLMARILRTPTLGLQTHVLNPKWFKKCVYAITKASEDLMRGKPRVWLTSDDIEWIVAQASAGLTPLSSTHPVEGAVIREALKFIGVCWEDEASGDFLFPRGLPERDWNEYLACGGHRLAWDFLPEHCVAKLLVRLHRDGLVISQKKGLYVHDRNAALIAYPADSENHALVFAVPEEGYVDIRYLETAAPDQRQSILQYVLTILQSPELQGRPPVISEIPAESIRAPGQTIRTTGLPSDREANFERRAGNSAVVGLPDLAPPFPAVSEWKGTLLVNPNPMIVASFEIVSQFYQIGLCYEQPDAPSQKEIAKRFHVAPSTVSRWEEAMRTLLTQKFPYSTTEPLVILEQGRKSELSPVGKEAMAWSEHCFPVLLELRKAIPG
jgi:Leucine-rich repeat (LRR) protein